MDEWYYAEDGESVGPVAADVVARVVARAGDQAQLVWSPGMPDWVDGRTLSQFAPIGTPAEPFALRFGPAESVVVNEKSAPAPARKSLLQRARHELIAYAAISAYLMVWFSAVLFYKSTVLKGVGVDLAPFGVAAVIKSLILAKFIIVLETVRLGERHGRNALLIVQIVTRALLFTVALIVMSVIEEVVVGYFHGHHPKEALAGLAGGSLSQVFAMAILMFLVLVPYLAFRRIALEIGELPELLFTRRGIDKAA
ncbi:MAG: GYF domain-containing protein [Methylocystis sp.]|uniref:GYF domain-containing protein n=1 Tax=Methylocystis sp. TaxID=1911079 RepID=UPI003DA28E50